MTPIQDAAGAIRTHLWKPDMPVFHGETKPWSMGRELNIFKLLCKGFRAADIVGAIGVVREMKPEWQGQPLSMRVFFWKRDDGFNSTPFLEQAIAFYLNREAKDQRYKKGGAQPFKVIIG